MAMDARRGIAVLIGVCLSIFAPALAGAVEPLPVAPITTPAAEPDVPAVSAKRRPQAPTSSPPLVDSGPTPVDAAPPLPEPAPLPAPPPPEPPAPEPAAPAPPEITPVPEPAPSARAPAGKPNLEAPTRLPTTGDGSGSRYPAAAGACLAFGGLCIALGARAKGRLVRR